MRPHAETDDPQLLFCDPTPQRYELIRPLLLDSAHTVAQRAQETGTHPETVGRLKRRFAPQGMLGLVPATQEGHPARRQLRVPERVVQELQRLKGLYTGFGARELARIIFHTTMYRLTGQTARRLWERLPPGGPSPTPSPRLPQLSRALSGPPRGHHLLCARLEQAQYQSVFARLPPHDHPVDYTLRARQ